jgi:hypothetical protein
MGGHVPERASGVKRASLLLLFLVGSAFVWSVLTPDRWLATVYPEAPSLLVHIHLDEYETLEECRMAALSFLRQQGVTDGLYECGLNCETFGSDSDMMLCEETSE